MRGIQRHDREWAVVVVLCAVISVICAIDRTAMSVAIIPYSAMYGWNDKAKGAVSSAFNVGHMITNLYGGFLAATMSPKLVLMWGAIVWSLFTLLTPVAADAQWLPILYVVRAIMGLGEGVAFPTMQAIIKGWVPPDKRSRALGLIYSGHQIGSILSLLISPFIVAASGVSALFYVYGALGFMWVGIWNPYTSAKPTVSSEPEGTPMLSVKSEPAEAEETPAPVNLAKALSFSDVPVMSFFKNRCFWALLVAHSGFGVGYGLCIAWLPTYYSEEFDLDLKQSSFLSILPWLVMALSTNASGWIADYLINKHVLNRTETRKTLQLVGNLGPGLCLLYLAWIPQGGSITEAVTLLTLAMATLGMQAGGFASTHTDISTKYASVLFGITNAACSLAGSIFLYLVGVILDSTGSWSAVFQLVALTNIVCAAVFFLLATSEPQFE